MTAQLEFGQSSSNHMRLDSPGIRLGTYPIPTSLPCFCPLSLSISGKVGVLATLTSVTSDLSDCDWCTSPVAHPIVVRYRTALRPVTEQQQYSRKVGFSSRAG